MSLLMTPCCLTIPAASVQRKPYQALPSRCCVAGCTPWWLQPECDDQHGIAHCITPAVLQQALQDALAQGHDVGAVMLVSPTYYGAAAKLAGACPAALPAICVTYCIHTSMLLGYFYSCWMLHVILPGNQQEAPHAVKPHKAMLLSSSSPHPSSLLVLSPPPPPNLYP
jgi:arginine/lysine/ornithine decarboxylase